MGQLYPSGISGPSTPTVSSWRYEMVPRIQAQTPTSGRLKYAGPEKNAGENTAVKLTPLDILPCLTLKLHGNKTGEIEPRPRIALSSDRPSPAARLLARPWRCGCSSAWPRCSLSSSSCCGPVNAPSTSVLSPASFPTKRSEAACSVAYEHVDDSGSLYRATCSQ